MSEPDPFAVELAARARGRVSADLVSRAQYATDASLYEVLPRAVLRVAEAEDLEVAVATCREHGIPITARGAGTSLAGQAVGPGLVIDCTRLDGVTIDAEARTARVGPGVVLDRLNEAAGAHGLWFGPDTATSNRCTLGGMIGNNSCGARSLVYGMTVEHVDELRVIGADGVWASVGLTDAPTPGDVGVGLRAATDLADRHGQEIAHRYPAIPRRASGYNLDRMLPPSPSPVSLLVGSEGTLALVAEASLRLVPRPRAVTAIALRYDAMDGALEAASVLPGAGVCSVELIDRHILRLAAAAPAFASRVGWVSGDPEAVLLVEAMDDREEEAAAIIERAIAAAGPAEVVRLDERARADAWAVRKAGLPLLYSRGGRRRPLAFVEDVAVPADRMPGFVAAFRAIVADAGIEAAFYAHAAAGCLHVRPMLDPTDRHDRASLLEIQRAVAEEALRAGGAMSGEHGDGRVRSHLLERFYGPEIVSAFAAVKRAFDPAGLLNPGVIVDHADPLADLRRSPEATEAALNHPEGLAAAAGRCFGAGVCLKDGGAMCPSYMVTRDEEHGTRARANVFRAALSGLIPRGELLGPGMAEVMDLCVGCKACKTDCPAGVDVAALKVEHLAARRRGGRTSIRDRMFASLPRIARAASIAPGIVNTLAQGWVGVRARERLGIGRAPPPVAGERFSAWFRRTAGRREGDRVVLLADTFTEFFEPSVGRAAVAVLARAGFAVEVVGGVCCGRPALSGGWVDRARRDLTSAVRALPADPTPVIVLEPSCASMFADDASALGVRVPGAVSSFDTFVASRPDRFPPASDGPGSLVHVHCHQRALEGADGAAVCAAVVGDASVVDAGCCGMAGSFGYETEHLETARRMGERALFPAVRAASGPVVAAGFSCRQHIRASTGVEALHPAELLGGAVHPEQTGAKR